MKIFKKIVNRISSKKDAYTTPFLDFKYEPEHIRRQNQYDRSINVIEDMQKIHKNEIKELNDKNKDLSAKMLTEILDPESIKFLSDFSSIIQRLETRIQELEKQKKILEYNSSENFFNK
tara:strand:+ start:170 stop:526 length:357 start_codon:yes stop_codon:yes gene_type:complete